MSHVVIDAHHTTHHAAHTTARHATDLTTPHPHLTSHTNHTTPHQPHLTSLRDKLMQRVVVDAHLEDFSLDKTSDFDSENKEGQRNRNKANILIGWGRVCGGVRVRARGRHDPHTHSSTIHAHPLTHPSTHTPAHRSTHARTHAHTT